MMVCDGGQSPGLGVPNIHVFQVGQFGLEEKQELYQHLGLLLEAWRRAYVVVFL